MTQLDVTHQVLREAGFVLSDDAALRLMEYSGRVLRVDEIVDGIVHRVARVRGARRCVIVKRREVQCRRAAAMQDPADILVERRALDLLESVTDTTVPRVVAFDRHNATLVLTDLSAAGLKKGDDVLSTASDATVIRAATLVAAWLADTHKGLSRLGYGVAVRHDGDVGFVERNLFERIGYHGTPGTDRLVAQLRTVAPQLIIGDLSPKNMLIGADRLAVFDFEHMHRGPRVFDIGFFAGHVVLHRLSRTRQPTLHRTLDATLGAYDARAPLDAASKATLGPLVAATVAYRLRNAFVAYATDMEPATADRVARRAIELVESSVPVGEVVPALCAERARVMS